VLTDLRSVYTTQPAPRPIVSCTRSFKVSRSTLDANWVIWRDALFGRNALAGTDDETGRRGNARRRISGLSCLCRRIRATRFMRRARPSCRTQSWYTISLRQLGVQMHDSGPGQTDGSGLDGAQSDAYSRTSSCRPAAPNGVMDACGAASLKQRSCYTHLTSPHLTSPHQVNSASHPSGVAKSSTSLIGSGKGGNVTSVGWQVTPCYPV